jgi:hypothetical protein
MKPSAEMKIELRNIETITPYERNPRRNDHAVEAVAKSIKEFGFQQPIVVDRDGVIIVGHTRYKAAKKIGITQVPVHVAIDLTPAQAKAYRIADNKAGETSLWDDVLLEQEMNDLSESFDMTDFGFENPQIEPTKMIAIEIRKPPAMAWVLVGIPTVRFSEINKLIESIAGIEGVFCETTVNDG